MRATISKTFDFDAAHFLPKVPESHKCHRMHGHTYKVEVICEGVVDDLGMVCDYAEIAEAWQPLHDRIDHRVLNDIPGLENPTTEVLVGWLWAALGFRLARWMKTVRVYESSTTWCEYSGPEGWRAHLEG